MIAETREREAVLETVESGPVYARGNRMLFDILRSPAVIAGVGLLLILGVSALLAPLISRYNPDAINVFAMDQLPSGAHWFGTDYLGRDLWARVIFGGRVSLPAGLGVVVVAAGIGVPLGLVAGYTGGILDDVIMRIMDVLLAFPGIILAILVIGILSPGVTSAVLAIGITSIPFFARLVRGSTLSVKEHDYIVAARVSGTRSLRLVRRHVLPNVFGPLIILCATTFGYAILATAALSYLGLGSQPPTSDWGSLMKAGYDHMFLAASEVVFPGLAILLTVVALNLAADGMSEALSVRS